MTRWHPATFTDMEEYKLQGTHTYWDWAYINHIAVRHMHTFHTHTQLERREVGENESNEKKELMKDLSESLLNRWRYDISVLAIIITRAYIKMQLALPEKELKHMAGKIKKLTEKGVCVLCVSACMCACVCMRACARVCRQD